MVGLECWKFLFAASESVSSQIMALKMEVLTAREAAKVCQERMNELRRQVDATKKQCVDRDRNLCDSIDTGTLTIIFKADKVGLFSLFRLELIWLSSCWRTESSRNSASSARAT